MASNRWGELPEVLTQHVASFGPKFAGKSLQGKVCREKFAGKSLQGKVCREMFAGKSLQGKLRQNQVTIHSDTSKQVI